jgi:hypothetical protein
MGFWNKIFGSKGDSLIRKQQDYNQNNNCQQKFFKQTAVILD